MIIDTSAQFLDRFFVELAKTGIDLSIPELDWDKAALHRDHFPLLKLKLANMWVKFPRIGLREQLGLV